MSFAFPVKAASYRLDIGSQMVNLLGKPVKKITVNGALPGPTLHFTEGEAVTVMVTNHLDETTSIHWHGFLIPATMDGVPGMNGFMGISPGETFTYHFHVRQSGTYWYHAHSSSQEQDGLYGSIVITPKGKDKIQSDRDYVVLISDFADDAGTKILGNLKMDSGYYNYAKRTLGDFVNDVRKSGFSSAWKTTMNWGAMRMSPTDLSDVSGYIFLINGKTPLQNWTGVFTPHQRVRLRFINASAMSIYDVRIPGLSLSVVQADGQNTEPVKVDEFRLGNAETYDVIVEPQEAKAYTIVAEPIDRTGFALGTLAPQVGMRGDLPPQRPRALLTMADMGMMSDSHDEHAGHAMSMDHDMADMQGMGATSSNDIKTGWADAHAPLGQRILDYKDLRYLGAQTDTRAPTQEITVRLNGNMQRYVWTLNGKPHEESEPMMLSYGERVRLTFVNETMMAHPMHLHGMFMQLENGQSAEKLPNKHTVIIPPGKTYSVLLSANEPGEWAFHCHLLYHMMSGMMTSINVTKANTDNVAPKPVIIEDKGYHHVH
ncbi:MAG: copper resistance system multicopper oxidase [Alphaproteobacteria bacterium]|nr:copper resistance system multicopper oxidase [Alphaproteobacteria bacterium]